MYARGAPAHYHPIIHQPPYQVQSQLHANSINRSNARWLPAAAAAAHAGR